MDLLKEFLRAAYDHFGGLVCINILWSLLSIPWLAAATAAALYGVALQGDWAPHARMLVIVLATEFVWFAPPTVLLFLAARQWLDGGSVSFRSLARQLPRHALRAQSAGMAIMATTCLLAINLVFYHHLGGWLGAVLSGLMGWVLLGACPGFSLFSTRAARRRVGPPGRLPQQSVPRNCLPGQDAGPARLRRRPAGPRIGIGDRTSVRSLRRHCLDRKRLGATAGAGRGGRKFRFAESQ